MIFHIKKAPHQESKMKNQKFMSWCLVMKKINNTHREILILSLKKYYQQGWEPLNSEPRMEAWRENTQKKSHKQFVYTSHYFPHLPLWAKTVWFLSVILKL